MTRRLRHAAVLAGCALLAGCVAPQPGGPPPARPAPPEGRAAPAQKLERVTYTVAADLLFTPDNFGVTPDGQAALNDIIGGLRGLKHGAIVVDGYTDDQKIGPPLKRLGINSNLDLSSRRADAVAGYLRAHGVDPNMISARGRGDTHPVAANNTPAGRARNRRVEIVVEGVES